ncbi:DNA integrity scanning protein DisA nucleotide-binding domain protein [Hymenobacter sp. BT683]|uniref:DNA integrity scanning protein DisA nucleotide-binding domain protein n=1 Tax=Hymenobacter jeongseonensis TaxID=2791027 RepID=A0ABS0IKZ3_9BACT|nr:DNA integrity scanning protein DisA nucleotide-binding domain protein [Hymenobacter jeongseonensis]MBF9238699.1 DNA integrity scanning protein DisA nucleotide-binding domain protein [Hymenobacter jeongseonensis]
MTPTLAPAAALLWPHQTRYRQAAQALAKDLFDALDDDLHPFVVLLALPTDPALPARCLEPDDCGLPSEAFSGVMARGRVIQNTRPRPQVETDSVSAVMQRRKLEGIGVRDAVQEILDVLDEHASHQHFAGYPIQIHGHFVVTIMRLQRKPVRAYPSLRPHRYYTDGRPLAPSLLVAAMYRFNEESAKALSEPEPGAVFIVRPRESEELLRSAGKSLLDTPAQALGFDPATTKLFATCNTISSLRYEGAEGVGKLLLARRGHPNIEEVFALTCPTELTDYRAVRKLLEMTTPDVHLLADGESVYALGRQVGKYDAVREDLFVINFVTHYSWELQHDGHVLLRSHYGLPGLPRTRINRSGFRRALKRTFGLIEPTKVERLWDVVLEASRQKHGTLLVITTEALAEADRLKLQCTLIEPVPLTPLITRLVTSIDGAVLLDPEGYCYSIGVILDGRASGRGDSTRGARYNSALRYVESSDYPCIAIVVSEDGLVDVITSEQE